MACGLSAANDQNSWIELRATLAPGRRSSSGGVQRWPLPLKPKPLGSSAQILAIRVSGFNLPAGFDCLWSFGASRLVRSHRPRSR
jgi:hypothetical protein